MAEQEFFDARVESVDVTAGIIRFAVGGRVLELKAPECNYWRVGTYGRLWLRDDAAHPFAFHADADQRLRRNSAGDVVESGLWCWTLEGVESDILVKDGIVAGEDGQVIEEETEPVEIAVPAEFTRLCYSHGLTPAQVLRGFVANVCGLMNYVTKPREDGYRSNGSDERDFAEQGFDRAYGWRARE